MNIMMLNNRVISRIILCIFVLLVYSCQNNRNYKRQVVLELDSIKSRVNNWELVESNKLIIIYGDSITINRSPNYRNFQNTLIRIGNSIYEVHTLGDILMDEEGNIIEDNTRLDTVLTFSVKDTMFIYNSVVDFTPTVFDYSLADCKYIIEKTEGTYKTTKQSLLDTTYKEIFFYDKDYHIYKFINTWKGNICVYVEKK